MISADYSKQKGVALLAVMILVLAVTMILANIFYRHQIDVSQAAVSLHTDQALLIALSGEGWSQELLIEDGKQSQGSPVDHYGEIWAQAMPLFPVEGGTLTGCISDLQSRINLNNFSRYAVGNKLQDEMNKPDQNGFAKTWLNLLELLQIPSSPAKVATITDWIDPDDNILSSWGAEQPDYESYDPPRRVANQPMTDVTELAAVSGYTVQEVQMLIPWITALPGAGTSQLGASATTPININTASEEILLALGGFYGQQFVDTVAQGRPFSNIDALYDNLNTNLGLWDVSGATGVGNGIGRANKIWPTDLINVWSSYFRVYLKAEIGEAEIEVTSIMHRALGNLNVISRDIALVPAVLPTKNELSEVEKLFAKSGNESGADDQYDADSAIVQPACLMMET
ncbi:MAG: type II secretion system minor pseudopilin GspK [Porticoccaceae bacterium]|nr:type II secretion system minor pseudopilin GspK [Porticoccaceae bacterium]